MQVAVDDVDNSWRGINVDGSIAFENERTERKKRDE
jgi:hypothetical protein